MALKILEGTRFGHLKAKSMGEPKSSREQPGASLGARLPHEMMRPTSASAGNEWAIARRT